MYKKLIMKKSQILKQYHVILQNKVLWGKEHVLLSSKGRIRIVTYSIFKNCYSDWYTKNPTQPNKNIKKWPDNILDIYVSPITLATHIMFDGGSSFFLFPSGKKSPLGRQTPLRGRKKFNNAYFKNKCKSI